MAKNIKCPTCDRPTVWEGNEFRPFCSERCRLIDLGKWADEQYRIPGPKTEVPEPSHEYEN